MHASATRSNPRKYLALGLTLIVLSIVFLIIAHKAPTAKDELNEFRGNVSNIKIMRGKYGISGFEFYLENESKIFRFESHGIDAEEIFTSLKNTKNKNIRILAHPNGELSWFSGLRRFPVYSVEIPNGPSISYEQFSKSWKDINSLSEKISATSAVSGFLFVFLFLYSRARPN
ncbi:hypothetical protein ACOCLD_01995 [Pseudomonas sp. MAC6]|uniref:hypothetical protein n=1 Tax=Pseudomonas sp. MAC6 TaxID=3401633 RepID=UPI003BF59C64